MFFTLRTVSPDKNPVLYFPVDQVIETVIRCHGGMEGYRIFAKSRKMGFSAFDLGLLRQRQLAEQIGSFRFNHEV